jgi:azurin
LVNEFTPNLSAFSTTAASADGVFTAGLRKLDFALAGDYIKDNDLSVIATTV